MYDPANLIARADILIEALPYMQRYAGQTFVVKYGGHAMSDPAEPDARRAAHDHLERIAPGRVHCRRGATRFS